MDFLFSFILFNVSIHRDVSHAEFGVGVADRLWSGGASMIVFSAEAGTIVGYIIRKTENRERRTEREADSLCEFLQVRWGQTERKEKETQARVWSD